MDIEGSKALYDARSAQTGVSVGWPTLSVRLAPAAPRTPTPRTSNMPPKIPTPAQLPTTRPKETRAASAAAHAEPVASPPSSRSRFIGQAEDMEFIPPEPCSLTNDPVPPETHDDPLADVPLIGPVTDRFTIQPGDIEFIVVGSIEVVIHPADTDDPND